MTTDLERVARAIWTADSAASSGYEDAKERYLDLARAAVEALMEPSETMEEAAWKALRDEKVPERDRLGTTGRVFQAMLRAVLEE